MLSPDEFAAKIKAKYPDYADIDNATLTRKVLAKYPDYASSVDTSSFNKPTQAEQPAPAEPAIEQPGIISKVAKGIGSAINAVRPYTAAIPATVAGGATFFGTMAGQKESSAPYIEQLKQAGSEALVSAKDAYNKGTKAEGLEGVVADPVSLASLFVAPEYGAFRTGLLNASLSGASEIGRQSAENPNAELDAGRIGTSAALGGVLGGGLKFAGSKLGQIASKRAAAEAANLKTSAENTRIEQINQGELLKLKKLYDEFIESTKLSNLPKNASNIDIILKNRMIAIKDNMRDVLSLPEKTKISDVDAGNWFDELLLKTAQSQSLFATTPLTEVPSLGRNIMQAAHGATMGAIAGHAVLGPLGAAVGGLVGTFNAPIGSAIDRTLTPAVVSGLSKAVLAGSRVATPATSVASEKLYSSLDELLAKTKNKK